VDWVGYLHATASQAPVLGSEEPVSGWPQVVQQPDIELLERRLGRELFPYRVRLEHSPGFDTGWITTNLSPAQHQGYAVQWFSLSIALMVLGVLSNSNLVELWRARRGVAGE
jgi:cytochrome oxidase assembly protein ShyY1